MSVVHLHMIPIHAYGDDHDGHGEDHDDDNGADHAIYDGVDKMTREGGGGLPLSATDHPPVWFGCSSALHPNISLIVNKYVFSF